MTFTNLYLILMAGAIMYFLIGLIVTSFCVLLRPEGDPGMEARIGFAWVWPLVLVVEMFAFVVRLCRKHKNKTMKTLLIGAVLLAAVTLHAQNFALDLNNAGSDLLAGPWVVGGGFEHTTSGTGASIGFVAVSYNLTPATNNAIGFTSGPIVGYDDEFGSRLGSQQESLSGGWQVSSSGHWFSFIGKTFLTNMVGTLTVHQLLTTPHGGAPVGAVTGGAASLDVYSVDNFHFKPSFLYDNRSGQGKWNGNFLGGALFISHNF